MSFVADLSGLVAASRDGRHACPPDWPRVPLGSVAGIINGFPFKSGGFGASGAPVIRIRDVTRGSTTTKYDGPIPEGFWVEAGDLIVGMDGDFSAAFWGAERALLNQRVCKIVPNPRKADRRYLSYVLPGYLELINANTPSVTVKHLSSRTLAAIPIPLPPLETQRQVANRIDDLWTEIDDGEGALARAQNDLATWRKALLKAAVTGELTADWRAANPPAESGADLLATILAERHACWRAQPRNRGKRYVDLTAPDEASLPTLPPSWTWASYDQCCETLGDQGLKLKERDYQREGHYPVIDQGAKTVAGFTDDAAMLQPVDRPWILFGDHSRRFKFVERPFCIGADGIKLIRPNLQLDPRFIWRFFQSAQFEDRGYSRHFQFVRALCLPIPPLAEQEAIVQALDEYLVQHEAMVQTSSELETIDSATLRQSILAAAFRGELVA